jgi:alkylhydroperoxidase family enzyme
VLRIRLATTLSLLATIAVTVMGVARGDEPTVMGWPSLLSSEEAWKVMPAAERGQGGELPTWARMLAREAPRTAAAFLELDLAQRTRSPVEPGLRSGMRYVAAKANGSTYAKATAAADAKRAGVTAEKLASLDTPEYAAWSPAERFALQFAHDMTLNSDGVTDDQFAKLVEQFSDRQAAAMVLAMAYANFQDRFLICLGAPIEENGPLPPVVVKFAGDTLTKTTTPPPANKKPDIPGAKPEINKDIIEDDGEFTWLPYEQLQNRLQQQRDRTTRLPIPEWSVFADRLPQGLMEKPSDIIWYKIAFGYADELAVPFEIYLRTAGAEISSNWDRAFGNCIFWMVTDAVKCPYCMGHCEMNWEVMGMDTTQIADLSQKLAGNDWSSFTEPQQQALAFARKLTRTPSKVTREEIEALRKGFGDQRAFFICLQASRYNYMTRISNGFQLTLEKGNPFWDYYRMPTPSAPSEKQESPKR